MNSNSVNGKPKSAKETAHPEVQHPGEKTGAPGDESSKAKEVAPDARHAQDKDGNAQQQRHKATK